jgi:protein O-mannosyl-transferase
MNLLIKNTRYLCLFLIVGFTVFFPALFNDFVWDDLIGIIDNPQLHQLNFPVLLGHNWFNNSIFYRPLQVIYFALLYSLFGQQAFFYHLIQLALHVVDTYLLFILFCLFFRKGISLVLALLFLVHPINVESVAWISATNIELHFFFGITALLLATKKYLSHKELFAVVTLLLLSVLTRETGILFLVLIIGYRYLFNKNRLKVFFVLGAGIGIVYALIRLVMGQNSYEVESRIHIAALPLWGRLLNAPAIFMYYLATFMYPLHLAIMQNWAVKTLTLHNFFIPLSVSTVFFILFFVLLYVLYNNDKKRSADEMKQIVLERQKSLQFAFFSLWFIISMVPLMQIIPLEMTVAERFFYFPLAGLLGMIGIGIQALYSTFPRYRILYFAIAFVLLSLCSLRTFIRTFDWKDNITLYGHDAKEQMDNDYLADAYGKELLRTGRFDEALVFAKKSAAASPTIDTFNTLGVIYQRKHQYKKAYDAYLQAIALSKDGSFHDGVNLTAVKLAYTNLPQLLLLQNKYTEATQFLKEQALEKFPDDATMYILLAVAEYNMHHQPEALEAANHAYELSSDEKSSRILYSIQHNLPVTFSQQH